MKSNYLVVLVFCLSIILLFFSFYFRPELGDEGILAMDGWRILRGEIPQKDFFQFIPPLSSYVQSTFFKLFGPSIFAIRLLGFVYGIILMVLTFLLYRKFIKSLMIISTALSFIVPFGVSTWLFGSHHWLVDILQIGGGIALYYACEKQSQLFAVVSGLFFGCATFTLQDQGGYLVIGLVIATFIVSKNKKKFFLNSAISAVVTFSLFSFPLILTTSFKDIFNDWVIFPFFHYKKGNQFSFINYLNQINGSWSLEAIRVSPLYAISSAISSTFQCFTPVLSLGSLLILFVKRYLEETKFVFVSIISISFLLGAFHRLAMTNLAWAFVSLFPFYILLDKLIEKKSKKLEVFIYFFVYLFLISNLVFSIFRSIHCIETGDSFAVYCGVGKYRFFDPYKSKNLKEFVEVIEGKVPKNEPMFCVGYIPLINFITGHPNPTKFNFVLRGGYNSKEQLVSWLNSLEEKKVEWGIGEKEVINENNIKLLLPAYEIYYQNVRYVLLKRKIER